MPAPANLMDAVATDADLTPVTPKTDMQSLFARWQEKKDPQDLGGLLTGLKPAIDASLRTYAKGDERLRVKANMLATEALTSWDPGKGQMNTHIISHLQRLRRLSAERSDAVHVPENVRMDGLAVRRYIADYKDQHGREPDQLTIADNVGISRKRVLKALGTGEEAESKQIDRLGFEPGTIKSDPRVVWRNYVYHDQDPVGRYILEHITGHGGAIIMKKGDIAVALKMSPAAVSQRISTLNKRLAEIDQLPNPTAVV